MADYTPTPANVVAASSATNQILNTLLSGGVINAGQIVYLDAVTNLWKLGNAATSLATSIARGVALNNCPAANQPLAVLTAGLLTTNAIWTAQKPLVLSGTTSGSFADVADLVTNIATWHACLMGVPISTTQILISILPSGV